MSSLGKSKRGAKIGIFGGTFNPPHIAHLLVAESVLDQLMLDKVLFVPAAIPPHKMDEQIIPADIRLQMVKAALADEPAFEACDIELRREGPSYSIDTIRELKGRYPGDELILMMGIDLLIDFRSWKNPKEILSECTVVVMGRPGFALNSVEQELLRRVEIVNVPGIDISSSDIRRRVKAGKTIRYMVPRAVEEYIHANSIYR